jgi:hypothetical protein
MLTVLLVVCCNLFMTFAWYGHLKYGQSWPGWQAILVSWLIALIEYCFAVPANRIGYQEFSGFARQIWAGPRAGRSARDSSSFNQSTSPPKSLSLIRHWSGCILQSD